MNNYARMQQQFGETYSPYEKPNNNNMDVMPPIDFNTYQQQSTINPHYPQMQHHQPRYNNPCENKYTYNMPLIEHNNIGYSPYYHHHQHQQPTYPPHVAAPPSYQQPLPHKWSFKSQSASGSSGSVSQVLQAPHINDYSAQYNSRIPLQPIQNRQKTPVQNRPITPVQNRPKTSSCSSTVNKTLPPVSAAGKLATKTTQLTQKTSTEARLSATQFQNQFSITQNTSLTQLNSSQAVPKTTSTQFLAVNVYGMRAWCQLKAGSNFIFELFGLLDSRPTAILGGKKFTIKDEQGRTVTCVFYEADRELQGLMRGRLYRCVGMFKSPQQQFHIVSIRAAGDRNEFQAHKKIAALTANYLRQVKHLTR